MTIGIRFGQGPQYSSRQCRQRLWRYRMRQSMSRRGNCRDDAPLACAAQY